MCPPLRKFQKFNGKSCNAKLPGFCIQKRIAKIKTICDTFLYTKIRHFHATRFTIEFLKFAEGRGHLFIKKTMYFA